MIRILYLPAKQHNAVRCNSEYNHHRISFTVVGNRGRVSRPCGHPAGHPNPLRDVGITRGTAVTQTALGTVFDVMIDGWELN